MEVEHKDKIESTVRTLCEIWEKEGSCINVVTDPENSQTSQLLPLKQEMGVSIVGGG